MLSPEIKKLVRQHIADFTEYMMDYATQGGDDEECLSEMEGFYDFICGALTVAIRDGRNSVNVVSVN